MPWGTGGAWRRIPPPLPSDKQMHVAEGIKHTIERVAHHEPTAKERTG